MKESAIEKKIGEYAESKGCTYDKLVCPNKRNKQDRFLINQYGVTGYLEVKKPGGEIRSGQVREWRKLRQRGAHTGIVDNVADGKKFVDYLCKLRIMDFNEPGDRHIDAVFDD